MKKDGPKLAIGKDGKNVVTLDVMTLITTKMLVQANSGGGKSYAVRVLAEQAMAHLQTIILDPDGEFASLREMFDLLLVGPDGDLDADVRAAGLLARRLVEKRCSAVIDLSELDPVDRQHFVRDFCLALLVIPKEKFRPMALFIDEAQEFCPEQGQEKSESTNAVVRMLTRGRKRGIGVCLAAQRMSQVRKTATGMCNNLLIGRTAQDVDRKRIANDLGLDTKNQRGLRELEVGEFWAYGPAFSHHDTRKIHIAKAQTTHPEPGDVITPPAAPAKIRAILHEFADLPERAKEEAKTVAQASTQLVRLERENAELRRKVGDNAAVVSIQKQLSTAQAELERLAALAALAVGNLDQAREHLVGVGAARKPVSKAAPSPPTKARPAIVPPPAAKPTNGVAPASNAVGGRGSGQHRMLCVLAQFHPDPCSDPKIGLLAKLAYKQGTYQTYMGRLRKAGYVDGDKLSRTITQAGLHALGDDWQPLPTGQPLRNYWLGKMGASGMRRILEALIDHYPHGFDLVELADQSGLTGSAGTFSTYLGKIRKLDLLEDCGRRQVRASPRLFEA